MATIVREPNVTMTLSSALQQISNTEQRALIIGQKTPAGTAVSGQLYTNLLSVNDVSDLAGAGSIGDSMYRNIRKTNGVSRVDAIFLSDAGGAVKATGVFTITGTPTATGELTFIVGSESDHSYIIPIALADTPTTIGTLLASAINADTKAPVTGANVAGVVTLTANNGGTLGNLIGIAVDGSSAGVTVALTAFSAGATDPVLTTVFDPIENLRYQTIAWAYGSNTATIGNFLGARWNVANNILDGVGVMTINSTYGNALSTLNALNNQSLAIFVDEPVNETAYKAPSVFEMAWCATAQISGIKALKLTTGASTTGLVIAGTGSNDRFGGMHMASFPYFNMPTSMSPRTSGTTSRGFTQQEQDGIKNAGGAIYGNNTSGSLVILGEVATTYKTDNASNTDVTFKYLEYVDTSSVCREFFSNNARARFGQTRLTRGGVNPNTSMVNTATIEAYFCQLYQELANMSLTQDGDEFMSFFRENLNVTIDMSAGLVTAKLTLPIVTQLRQLLADIEITFNV